MKWEMAKLGDVASFINGYPFKPTDWSTEGLEIIRIQNLTKSSSEANYFLGKIPEKYQVNTGDILISWSATLDVFVWERDKAWLNQHIFKVVFDKKEIDRLFFIYLIKHVLDDMRREVHGATMKHITKEKFDNLLVPLPPLATQKRIAAILDAADALRRKDQALLQKYDELAQAIFVDMFGDPVKNEKGWEVKTIRSIANKIGDGPFGSNLKTEHYSNEGIRVIRLKNIGVNSFNDNDSAFVSFKHYETVLKKYTCIPGDILIGTLGEPNLRACIFPSHVDKAVNKADCVMLRVNQNICNQEYVCFLLNEPSFVESVQNNLHGQTRTRISMGQVANLEIPIPPKSIQDKFKENINILVIQKEKVILEIAKSETLFQSLLQKAFNAELVP